MMDIEYATSYGMSYQKKKLKKGMFEKFKYRFGQIKLALLKKARVLLQRRQSMEFKQTQKIMESLRLLNRGAVKNNKKIDNWVDSYINDCVLNGRPVEILLQWCSGLGLVGRREKQGGSFKALPTEIGLIQKEIPRVIRIFTEQGVKVSWLITFNRSYIERRRLIDEPFFAYMAMIKELASNIPELNDFVLFLDWEELAGPIKPNQEILTQFDKFVTRNAIEYELKTFQQMLKQYPDSLASEDELKAESEMRIAFESEEARFLAGTQSPFTDGQFILIPLEKPERYVFFDLLTPGFTRRVASVVKLYPWRLQGL